MTKHSERIHVQIGRHLYELRRQRGLSLRNVATRAKVSPTWLSLVERARGSLSLDALHRVCIALGVELDDFLHDHGTPALLVERAPDPVGLAEVMRAVYDLEDLSGVVELVRRWRMEAL